MDSTALINGYFEDSLSENQLEEFEHLLKTDADFASAFEFEKEVQTALKKEERREIKDLFSSLDANEEKGAGKVISMRPWIAAASIALVVGLGSWLLFFNNPTMNGEQLYFDNFAPYDNVVHPIERGNQLEDIMTRAFTAYEDGDYDLALDLFKELNIKQNDAYIDFYEAMVLMQLDDHSGAIPLLKNYIKNNGELTDRAHWYLALAYLKLNKIENSKMELENLVQLEGFKYEDAERLLKDLN